MLDIETLGTKPGFAVVGIGAVAAGDAEILSTFSAQINLISCQKAGLQIDADTVLWWMRQEDAARREVYDAAEKLPDALDRFAAWFAEWGSKETNVWGNGIDFDNVILAAAYELTGRRVPWRWTRNRCYRTVKAIFDTVPEPVRQGVRHHPLDDAVHQMNHLQNILAFRKVALPLVE